MLKKLYALIVQRRNTMPTGSYVSQLFGQGTDRIAQKVGEEAVEVIIAAKNDNKDELVSEITDLVFHLLVLMADRNITIEDVDKELEKRQKN
ncbi:MAG: phosphoribosyl-ATP diphosphatase [Candidatus Blackburnbacteria bacterium]|uniref:Phosphoribosyl-ATP pyrophosphatase n=1 Tax=Candidatus Blackburnbacteria bacterium RIFCSPHIGHO2_01_FULL_43_15b TaxID=1797513 RepID=A0A1G1UXC9_9BACT|nr:phosphoribosyl-ATP diphosphatase [Candidatus Blackburnbacteria bacterium]OGY07784.1 MAG: phosphoribosyl-ATP diphosphatase [Candidatus Blackburnbacteria bacterium RIFCSPHIGHO2_01_FULL_43_15b]